MAYVIILRKNGKVIAEKTVENEVSSDTLIEYNYEAYQRAFKIDNRIYFNHSSTVYFGDLE